MKINNRLRKTKVLLLKPILTDKEIDKREGEYVLESECKKLIKTNTDAYYIDETTGNRKLLFKFRKNVIPNDISSSHSPDILSIISIFFFLSIESENNFNVPVSTCDDKLYDGVFSDEYLSNITFSIFLIIFIVSVFFSGV